MASEEDGWYVTIEGEQFGPYTWEEVLSWLDDGRVDAEDLCWREGFEEWVPLSSLLGKAPETSPAGQHAPEPRASAANIVVPIVLVLAVAAGAFLAYRGGQPSSAPPASDSRPGVAAEPQASAQAIEVQQLCQKGYDAIRSRDYGTARRHYTEALVACGADVALAGLANQARQQLQWIDLTENPSKRFVITNTIVGAKVTLAIFDRRENEEYRVHPEESFAGFLLESYDPATKSAKIYGDFRNYTIGPE